MDNFFSKLKDFFHPQKYLPPWWKHLPPPVEVLHPEQFGLYSSPDGNRWYLQNQDQSQLQLYEDIQGGNTKMSRKCSKLAKNGFRPKMS